MGLVPGDTGFHVLLVSLQVEKAVCCHSLSYMLLMSLLLLLLFVVVVDACVVVGAGPVAGGRLKWPAEVSTACHTRSYTSRHDVGYVYHFVLLAGPAIRGWARVPELDGNGRKVR